MPLAQAAGSGGLVAEDVIEFGDQRRAAPADDLRRSFLGSCALTVATGETRVRRMLAVCGGGRILNPKSARSQVIGAMVMGVGAALTEEHRGRQAARLLRQS